MVGSKLLMMMQAPIRQRGNGHVDTVDFWDIIAQAVILTRKMQERKEEPAGVCGARWDGRGGDHRPKGNWKTILMMWHKAYTLIE